MDTAARRVASGERERMSSREAQQDSSIALHNVMYVLTRRKLALYRGQRNLDSLSLSHPYTYIHIVILPNTYTSITASSLPHRADNTHSYPQILTELDEDVVVLLESLVEVVLSEHEDLILGLDLGLRRPEDEAG